MSVCMICRGNKTMRDKIYGVKLYRARIVGTKEYVEGYPVVIEVLDCKDPGHPKSGYIVDMYTITNGHKLSEITGTNTYLLEPRCVVVDPESLVCISDKPDDFAC